MTKKQSHIHKANPSEQIRKVNVRDCSKTHPPSATHRLGIIRCFIFMGAEFSSDFPDENCALLEGWPPRSASGSRMACRSPCRSCAMTHYFIECFTYRTRWTVRVRGRSASAWGSRFLFMGDFFR